MKEHRIRINEVSWNKLVAMSYKQFDAHERMEQAIDLLYDNYIFQQTNFDYSEDIRSRLSSIESLLQGMDTDLLWAIYCLKKSPPSRIPISIT